MSITLTIRKSWNRYDSDEQETWCTVIDEDTDVQAFRSVFDLVDGGWLDTVGEWSCSDPFANPHAWLTERRDHFGIYHAATATELETTYHLEGCTPAQWAVIVDYVNNG